MRSQILFKANIDTHYRVHAVTVCERATASHLSASYDTLINLRSSSINTQERTDNLTGKQLQSLAPVTNVDAC
jgi:hypothetical protein